MTRGRGQPKGRPRKRGRYKKKKSVTLNKTPAHKRGCVPGYAFRALSYAIVYEHGQKTLDRVAQLMEERVACSAEEFIEIQHSEKDVPFEIYDGLVALLAEKCGYCEDMLPPTDALGKPEPYSRIDRYSPGQMIKDGIKEGVVIGVLDNKVRVCYSTGKISELENINFRPDRFRKQSRSSGS